MMTVTHVDASSGNMAYWLVTDPAAAIIDTHQLVNRSGIMVTIRAKEVGKDWVIGTKLFHQGDPVSIALPVGNWVVERSDDGIKYTKVTGLASLPGQPLQTVNFILDGAPFNSVYGRYTLSAK